MNNKKVADICIVENETVFILGCDIKQPELNLHKHNFFFSFLLIVLLKLVDLEKQLYNFQCNRQFYKLFKINRMLIRYSKWRPL